MAKQKASVKAAKPVFKAVKPARFKVGGGLSKVQNSAQPLTTQELKPAPPPKSK